MTTSETWERVIGILGGLGPHAHLEFEALLLDTVQRSLGRPAKDQDYPPWVLSSMPTTPDRTAALLEGTESPVPALVRGARRLAGADFAVMPCNCAHAFLKDVRPQVSIPFIDMIRSTARRAIDITGADGTIGILAATGTLKSNIYHDAIAEASSEARVVTPLDLIDGAEIQKRSVQDVIYAVKSGAYRDPATRQELAGSMGGAAKCLADAGATLVLTACTEIPLVIGRDSVDGVRLLDPMAVAAEEAIGIAQGKKPLPE